MKKFVILSVTVLMTIIVFAFTKTENNKKVTIMISHEVKDYASWKKGFDDDEVNRKGAGMKVTGLYRGVENQNIITATIEAPSSEVANKFLSNPDLKSAMEKAGVISAPEIKVLNKVQ